MTENPYSAPTMADPVASTGTPTSTTTTPPSWMQIARATFLAWEKLRIAYIAILAVISLLLIGPSGLLNRRLLILTVEGALFANAAYFAGPIVETYVKWLGYNRSWPRWVMFVGGTLLSIILAVGLLATELLPDQD